MREDGWDEGGWVGGGMEDGFEEGSRGREDGWEGGRVNGVNRLGEEERV